MGRYEEACRDYAKAIELHPNDANPQELGFPDFLNNYATLLATAPIDSLRDWKRAVELASKACSLSDYKDANIVDTLAAAYAESGDFESAIKWAEKARELATANTLREEIEQHLNSFRSGQPWRLK